MTTFLALDAERAVCIRFALAGILAVGADEDTAALMWFSRLGCFLGH